jgi:hypothetical protein
MLALNRDCKAAQNVAAVCPDEKLDKIIEKASDEFWKVIVKEFPEVKTGDYSPELTWAWNADCKNAVKWWLFWNHPKVDQNI